MGLAKYAIRGRGRGPLIICDQCKCTYHADCLGDLTPGDDTVFICPKCTSTLEEITNLRLREHRPPPHHGRDIVPIDVLQPDRLAKADALIMDEAILDVVELVDVLHNGLTLILYKVLDESISADGNTKANVAVNHKRLGREQGTEVREGEVGIDHVLCCSVRISRRDTLDKNLGLVEIKVEASVLLEYMLDSGREHF